MKKYYVDLTSRSVSERAAICKRLDDASFFATPVCQKVQPDSALEPKGAVIVGVDVFWESAEDFERSAVYPAGCPCEIR